MMECEIFASEPIRWLPAVTQIKNAVIGSNCQKNKAIERNMVPRLLQFMVDDGTPVELRTESAVVLGSLAKGPESAVQVLIESGVCPVLLTGLQHSSEMYVEACLRCLRSILCRVPTLAAQSIYQEPGMIPLLVRIMPRSVCTQECVATIFASCCSSVEQQNKLGSNGAVTALAGLLSTKVSRVEMPVLRSLAVLCHHNVAISKALANEITSDGCSVVDSLVHKLSRDNTSEVQMSAAKCLAYMCRAGVVDLDDKIIARKTLATLVRMCKPDKTWEERVEGAETLGYLTEVDLELQHIASISDHIISTLAEYFKYPGSPPDASLMPTKKDDIIVGNELRQAAFRAYASLCANDEDVKRKVIETKSIMEHIVNGLSDPVTKVQVAAVRCLHSLSRSVQQLRTSVHDHDVAKPLMQAFLNTSDESLLLVVTAIMCNLLLEFSPSKEQILHNGGVVEKLFSLTYSDNTTLRLNGIWALMNMTFQSEQALKDQVLNRLENDNLFRLVRDPVVHIVLKTLGLLRNLLSDKSTIDTVMSSHGTHIVQAVVLVLEGDHSAEIDVKEQALCVLTNIADGNSAKNCIMSNDDVLRKILNYLVQNEVILQIAAVTCVYNLVRRTDEGYIDRQNRLREMGLCSTLQILHSTSNTDLLERVKTAFQQF